MAIGIVGNRSNFLFNICRYNHNRNKTFCYSYARGHMFLLYKYHILYRLIFLLRAFICCHPEERSDVRTSSFVFSHDSRFIKHESRSFYFLLFYLLLSFPLAFCSIPLLSCYSFHLGSYFAIRSILTPTSPFFYTSPTLPVCPGIL